MYLEEFIKEMNENYKINKQKNQILLKNYASQPGCSSELYVNYPLKRIFFCFSYGLYSQIH